MGVRPGGRALGSGVEIEPSPCPFCKAPWSADNVRYGYVPAEDDSPPGALTAKAVTVALVCCACGEVIRPPEPAA